MKAMVVTQYGAPEVLQVQERPKPSPQDNQVLVKVAASSVNYGDLVARNFKAITPKEFNMSKFLYYMAKLYFGKGKPKISVLGNEFSGTVEAIGKSVKRFQTGDAVLGYLGEGMGAYAEYVCVPENGCLAHKPANLSLEDAAVLPYGAVMAIALLRPLRIQPGQKVLVIGASGGIGSAAVQLAKAQGASVTGVCGSARLAFVKKLGADRALDYAQDDYTQAGENYDLILDVLGRSSFQRCRGVLAPSGRYLRASFKTRELWQMLWTALFSKQKVVCSLAPGSREDLLAAVELMAAGKIKAVIDRRFPMAEAAAAHRYVEEKRQTGYVVIVMAAQ